MSDCLGPLWGYTLPRGMWLGALLAVLPGCGRVSEVPDEGSGGSGTGSGGDAIMGGTGSSDGGGGATSGMDGGGGHQVNNCPDLTGLPSPPKKEIVPTHSEDPLPIAEGGQIPVPSEFVLTALRLQSSKVVAIADDGAIRFVSGEHVEKFHWDLANAYAWRTEKETKLVFTHSCYVDGAGYSAGIITYDYTYADDVLTLVLPKKDPPEIYTFRRIKK